MLMVIDYQLSQFKGHVIFHLTETVKKVYSQSLQHNPSGYREGCSLPCSCPALRLGTRG